MTYSLLSSTRFDPFLATLAWNSAPGGVPSPFMLLSLHLDRLRNATVQHGWERAATALSLPSLIYICQDAVNRCPDRPRACKIRITLSQLGVLNATANPTQPFEFDPMSVSLFNPDTDKPPLSDTILTVLVDTRYTLTSLFTVTKTTHRDMYDEARSRALLRTQSLLHSDIILYNPDGFLTEASIYNFAVHRFGTWVTPSLSTGCLPGVLRRWLLEQGRIREDHDNLLTKDCLKEGEFVLLFNGVQGCRLGRIIL